MNDFDDRVICQMVIQPPRAVLRDMVNNSRWLFAMFGVIAVVLLISSAIASCLTDGFVVNQIVGGVVTPKVVTMDYWTALYFTFINSTTVGFGDIFPITPVARALAIFNAVFGVLTFASLVSVALMALQPSSPAEGQIDFSPLAKYQQNESKKTLREAAEREIHAQRMSVDVDRDLEEVHEALWRCNVYLRRLLRRPHAHCPNRPDLPVEDVLLKLLAVETRLNMVCERLSRDAPYRNGL